MIVARYKGMIGYLIYLANTTKVGFKTNGSYYKIPQNCLEDGKYILPIPFYNDKEAQILNANSNGSFHIKVLGMRSGTKYERIYVTAKEISWYLLDSSTWDYQARTNAKVKYGLNNLDIVYYARSI